MKLFNKNDSDILSAIASLFSDNKDVIRLAVVGATSSGKTYLLTDMIGSLYKLGYVQKDRLEDSSPHHSVLELIDDVTSRRGGVRTTKVYACRGHNHYASDFTGPDNLHLEFLDVPGEVMTPDSIRMFHAVMKSLMSCPEKMFTETVWKNRNSKKTIRLVEYYEENKADATRRQTPSGPVLHDPRQTLHQVTMENIPEAADEDSLEVWANNYMSTRQRKDYYRQKGYRPTDSSRVSGKSLFQHFFEYDTDTVVNAIADAWRLLDIDGRLTGGASGMSGSGRDAFLREFKNHFYFHYYTFYATDVVVCDKCCVPTSAGLQSSGTDHFPQMMHALVSLTSYVEMKQRKNWYLAFKGIDALMVEDDFRQLYQATHGDINLVYAHFVTLFRQACASGLISDPHALLPTCPNPFASKEEMADALVYAGSAPQEVIDDCYDQYENACHYILNGHLLRLPGKYTMTHLYPIDEHVRLRVADFCQADPQLLNVHGAVGDLLRLPPHVFFTATPIDDDFHICPHRQDDNQTFEGSASRYNRRACFGALQLTANMLYEHDLGIVPEYDNAGGVLAYLYGL